MCSRSRRLCAARALGGILALVSFASQSFADFTNVNPPTVAGEQSIRQILNHVYGGNFSPSGLNYNNGSITAVRIEDTPPANRSGPVEPVNLVYNPPVDDGGSWGEGNVLHSGPGGGLVTDQLWTAESVHATARARYASFGQRFGYLEGTGPAAYQAMFNVGGSGFSVTGSDDLDDMSGHIWRWARNGDNGIFTSQNNDNPDDVDHMITYRIDGNFSDGGGTPITKYLVFWEDLKPDQHPDYDYNDMVIELCTTPGPSVPEQVGAAAILLGGIIGARRRR